MNKKVTVLAAAIALAISGSAFAADLTAPVMPEVPASFDETHESSKHHPAGAVHQYGATDTFGSEAIKYTASWTGSNEYVDGQDRYSNAFLLGSGGSGNSILTNHADIWVFNSTAAYSVQAISISQGYGTLINRGNIYLNGSGNFADRTTGIAVDGTSNQNTDKVINYGTIIADNAHAIRIATSSVNDAVENHGQIVALNGGRGITIAGTGTGHTIDNAGDIFVQDESSIGILVNTTQNSDITNSGNIIAEEGGYAIKFETSQSNRTTGNRLNLEGASHIEGTVEITASTSLNISDLDNRETIELSVINNSNAQQSAALSQVNVTDSDIIFENAGKGDFLRFDNVTFSGDSSLGAAEGTLIKIKGEIAASDGNANFVATDLGQIQINTDKASVADDTTINTKYEGTTVADKLAGGEITLDDILADSIQGQLEAVEEGVSNNTTVEIDSGYIGDGMTIATDENGSSQVTNVVRNQLTASNIDLAKVNALAWRSELQSLTDRMSTLRTVPETAGLWVRYKGGEYDGEGINQKFNGFEIGADKMITENFMAGIAASYASGDGDLDNGSADTDVYSGAIYLSYFNGGWFIDVMGKVGKVSTDFDLYYNGLTDSGDYDLMGFLAGVETGYRFIFDNFFVEPQVQLTYSYLGDKQFSTAERSIDFDAIKSVIGRVGFLSGYDFDDLGSVFVRASYYHDFDGDIDMKVGRGALYTTESDELDSDWGDVGVGANLRLGGATFFLEASRTYGSDIDLEWKANAGVRYSF